MDDILVCSIPLNGTIYLWVSCGGITVDKPMDEKTALFLIQNLINSVIESKAQLPVPANDIP